MIDGLMSLKNNKVNTIPLEEEVVKSIKTLTLDMIDNASSGHPGSSLDFSAVLYTIYAKHLRFSRENDKWCNRDRLVLSSGHAVPVLYATLYMLNILTLDDIKSLRQVDSITPGHPEYGHTPFVDASTGPLGQGIGEGVGLAVASKYLENTYKKEKLFDNFIYVLCGDGDLMEGISYEALSFAGTNKLNNLILIYNANNISLDGKTSMTFTEDIELRFKAINFNIYHINNQDNITEINDVIVKAKVSNDKPSIIIMHSIIGKGTINEGTSKVHGNPLDKEDLMNYKRSLNMYETPFMIYYDAVNLFNQLVNDRIIPNYNNWLKKFNNLADDTKNDIMSLENATASYTIKNFSFDSIIDEVSLRDFSGKIMNHVAINYKYLLGGSADVSISTKTYLNDLGDFSSNNYTGRNIWYGVREHASSSISNGIALAGLRPFVSTFLVFSDYMKPSIRMSAMMHLPVIYIFTHDSITVGEDGPSHQPIEQLVGLSSIPNLTVFRPGDANELLGVYRYIFEHMNTSAIILPRGKVKTQTITKSSEIEYGGYIIQKERQGSKFETIVSSGEELALVLDVVHNLEVLGYNFRIVSMPSVGLFKKNSLEYQKEIIPENNVIVVSMSSSYLWYYFTKKVITIDEFGASGKINDIMNKYGFTKELLEAKILEYIKK